MVLSEAEIVDKDKRRSRFQEVGLMGDNHDYGAGGVGESVHPANASSSYSTHSVQVKDNNNDDDDEHHTHYLARLNMSLSQSLDDKNQASELQKEKPSGLETANEQGRYVLSSAERDKILNLLYLKANGMDTSNLDPDGYEILPDEESTSQHLRSINSRETPPATDIGSHKEPEFVKETHYEKEPTRADLAPPITSLALANTVPVEKEKSEKPSSKMAVERGSGSPSTKPKFWNRFSKDFRNFAKVGKKNDTDKKDGTDAVEREKPQSKKPEPVPEQPKKVESIGKYQEEAKSKLEGKPYKPPKDDVSGGRAVLSKLSLGVNRDSSFVRQSGAATSEGERPNPETAKPQKPGRMAARMSNTRRENIVSRRPLPSGKGSTTNSNTTLSEGGKNAEKDSVKSSDIESRAALLAKAIWESKGNGKKDKDKESVSKLKHNTILTRNNPESVPTLRPQKTNKIPEAGEKGNKNSEKRISKESTNTAKQVTESTSIAQTAKLTENPNQSNKPASLPTSPTSTKAPSEGDTRPEGAKPSSPTSPSIAATGAASSAVKQGINDAKQKAQLQKHEDEARAKEPEKNIHPGQQRERLLQNAGNKALPYLRGNRRAGKRRAKRRQLRGWVTATELLNTDADHAQNKMPTSLRGDAASSTKEGAEKSPSSTGPEIPPSEPLIPKAPARKVYKPPPKINKPPAMAAATTRPAAARPAATKPADKTIPGMDWARKAAMAASRI